MRIVVMGAVLDPTWKGGEPIVAKNVVEGLKRYGCEVSIISKKRALYDEILGGASDINPHILRFYLRRLKNIKPEVALIFFDYDNTALYACKMLHIPCVVAIHIYWPFCPYSTLYYRDQLCRGVNIGKCLSHIERRNLFYKFLSPFWNLSMFVRKKLALKFLMSADAIIVPSKYVARLFIESGFSNVHVVYTGIALNETPFKQKIVKNKKIINTTGSTSIVKGFQHYLMLAERVSKLRNDVEFVATGFYGNIGKVKGLGYLSRKSYIKLISECYLSIVPVLWADPCPQAVLLSMATGTPVIAYSVGGIPELLDEGGGILVSPGDITGLVKETNRLLNDETLINKMGILARKVIERKFTNEHMVKGYYDILINKI